MNLQEINHTTNKRVGIKEAARLTGLSPYMLRKGVVSGRFPVIQISDGGKYLFDVELLEQILRTEALSKVHNTSK